MLLQFKTQLRALFDAWARDANPDDPIWGTRLDNLLDDFLASLRADGSQAEAEPNADPSPRLQRGEVSQYWGGLYGTL